MIRIIDNVDARARQRVNDALELGRGRDRIGITHQNRNATRKRR